MKKILKYCLVIIVVSSCLFAISLPVWYLLNLFIPVKLFYVFLYIFLYGLCVALYSISKYISKYERLIKTLSFVISIILFVILIYYIIPRTATWFYNGILLSQNFPCQPKPFLDRTIFWVSHIGKSKRSRGMGEPE